MNDIKEFKFINKIIRIIIIDNKPFFCVSDLRDTLGIPPNSRLIQRLIHRFSKSELVVGGKNREVYFCSESDMYKITMRSNSIMAEEFQDWVCSEVLPAIRKHGAYMSEKVIEQTLSNPDTIIELAMQLKAYRAERDKLQAEKEINAEKITFAENVEKSEDVILIGTFAKILKQNGIDIGEKRLFKWLRENKYLLSKKGDGWNMPTQTSMDLKLFKIVEGIYYFDGMEKISKTPYITGKGQIYFTKKLSEYNNEDIF